MIELKDMYIITTVSDIDGYDVDDSEDGKGVVVYGESNANRAFDNLLFNELCYCRVTLYNACINEMGIVIPTGKPIKDWLDNYYRDYTLPERQLRQLIFYERSDR